MCEACFEDYDMAPTTPKIKNAVAWLVALHQDHGAGGRLHVYVDDMNLPVPETLEDWTFCLDSEPDDIEMACWDALRTLTEQEQATALAIYWGYHQPEHPWSQMRLENGIWGEGPYWPSEVEEAMGRKAYTLLKGTG